MTARRDSAESVASVHEPSIERREAGVIPQQCHNTPAEDELVVVEHDSLATGIWTQLPALVEGGSCSTSSSGQDDSDETASWHGISVDEICWPAQELREDPEHEDTYPILRVAVESPSSEWWSSHGYACPML